VQPTIREYRHVDDSALAALVNAIPQSSPWPPRVWADRYGSNGLWLASADYSYRAVAEHEDMLVGHIGVTTAVDPQILQLVAGVVDITHAMEIIKLVTAPAYRRLGIATTLLDTATSHITSTGAAPVLGVFAGSTSAITLYERSGWVCAGTGIGSDSNLPFSAYYLPL
jgi:GNAT superfamily N-acetyltransferase